MQMEDATFRVWSASLTLSDIDSLDSRFVCSLFRYSALHSSPHPFLWLFNLLIFGVGLESEDDGGKLAGTRGKGSPVCLCCSRITGRKGILSDLYGVNKNSFFISYCCNLDT